MFVSHVPFICIEKCSFLLGLIYKNIGFREKKLSWILHPGALKASVGCSEELALDGDINLKTGCGGGVKLMMRKHHDAVQNLSRTLNCYSRIRSNCLMTMIEPEPRAEIICVVVVVVEM